MPNHGFGSRPRAHGLGGHARASGMVNTPDSDAITIRSLIKKHGFAWVENLCGLKRTAVCSLAAGLNVQAQTLLAAKDGIARAAAAEREEIAE